jgi:glycosyltransferase involved in cell wall biosynthesis
VAGQRGILVDDLNALVVPVGAPGAMADALVRVCDDVSLAHRLGAAAQATFDERFTMERAADGMVQMYRGLATAG